MDTASQSGITNDNIRTTRKRIRIQDWSDEPSDKMILLRKTSMEKSTQTKEIKSEYFQNPDIVKSKIYKALLSKLEIDLECAICKEIYLDCCILPCGHIFCSFCIRMWFLNADSCPICRLATEFIIGTKIIDNFLAKLLSEIDHKLVGIRQQMILDRKAVLQQAEANWVTQNNNHYYPTQEMWQEWLSSQGNEIDIDRSANDEESNTHMGRAANQVFNDISPFNQRTTRNMWPWSSEETLTSQDPYNELSANLENDNLTVELDYENEERDS